MQNKIFLAVAVAVLATSLVGCGKHTVETSTQSSGQAFNAVQFFQDFGSASPELKTLANQAWMSIQSGAFPDALKYLGQLDANPALNAAQKKSVADLTGQVRKQMSARAAVQ
jgi:hypothetical protein